MNTVAILKTCLNFLFFSGLAAAFRTSLRGRGSIFCLHHVVPFDSKQSKFSPNSKLEITPQYLAETIALVRQRGYETLSLSEALGRLQNPDESQKPFAVFTLDDGYKDNLIHAQPVFKKLNCPYTVYVSPGIADGSVELWWRALERVIAENVSIFVEISGFTHSYKTETCQEKCKAWDRISVALLRAPEYLQREITRDFARRYKVDLKSMCLETAMTWDEIRLMAQDPLCTIGAHTMGHYAIKKLELLGATQELELSKKTIAEKLGQEVLHFAFPYGDEAAAGVRDFEIAEKVGFQTSVTTRHGVVYADHLKHLQALPRIMVSGRYAQRRYLDVLISGIPGLLKNRFKTLNVN